VCKNLGLSHSFSETAPYKRYAEMGYEDPLYE